MVNVQLFFGRGEESVSIMWERDPELDVELKPCPQGDGWLEMNVSKPIHGRHIASNNGTWEEVIESSINIEIEHSWQKNKLSRIELEISSYLQDQAIPIEYSELRVTAYTEQQYYDLLMDRKLLNEYVLQSDFPECGRPTLSGLV